MNLQSKSALVFSLWLSIWVTDVGPSLASDHLPIITLNTYINPPYQFMEGNELKGGGVDTLSCVFDRMQRKFIVSVAPRNRNRHLLKAKRLDGIFLSIPDDELNDVAVATQPLAIERWKFFSLVERLPRPDSRSSKIGAVLGSNETIWLRDNNFANITFSTDMTHLTKVLHRNRLEYALADEGAFLDAAENSDIPPGSFHSSFVRYVPLVAYFSNSFIVENPGFLRQFNRYIDVCLEDFKVPTEKEKSQLLTLVESYINSENQRSLITDFIKNIKSLPYSAHEKIEQDRLWIQGQKKGVNTPLMTVLMNNALSEQLTRIAKSSQGKITEIFVFDHKGYILGLNQVTSDYWQGDEEKYLSIFANNAAINYSQLVFDLSTRKFQVSITFPLFDPDTGEKIAGLTIGLDADLALGEYNVALTE